MIDGMYVTHIFSCFSEIMDCHAPIRCIGLLAFVSFQPLSHVATAAQRINTFSHENRGLTNRKREKGFDKVRLVVEYVAEYVVEGGDRLASLAVPLPAFV